MEEWELVVAVVAGKETTGVAVGEVASEAGEVGEADEAEAAHDRERMA